MPAGQALRRSLLLWGLGHVSLGDGRGWLLAVVEVLGLASLLLLGPALAATDAAPWLFLGLVAFFAAWGGQAVAAYRLALERGGRSGGAEAILALAPVAIVAFTGFWLVGGSAGSPSAALQAYVSAWRGERADIASALYEPPRDAASVEREWDAARDYLTGRLTEISAAGAGTGIDPQAPFSSLLFEFPPSDETGGGRRARPGDTSRAIIQIVRRETVSDTLFGLVPTASQRTVAVERFGEVRLRAEAVAGPGGILPAVAWRIAAVCLGRTSCGP
jgi:hypothetical protein